MENNQLLDCMDADFFNKLQCLATEVKQNFKNSCREFEQLKKLCSDTSAPICQTAVIPENCVWVRRTDLLVLQRETRTLQQNLRKAVNSDLEQAYALIDKVEHELEVARQELERATNERDHWQARCETALADASKEKEEKYQLQCDLQEMSEQLSQQSAYCASMGAATCTLLWRVSRCEDSIESIIVGCKVDEFVSMTSSTVDSYVDTYKEAIPQEKTDETVFILALCGIITNIAASPCGRDFLMTRDPGRTLLDTFFTVLSEAPSRKCARMKNLILMTLYNVSINKKGLKYISAKPGILGVLAWLLQEETDVESRLHSLLLLQSLLCEHNCPKLLQESREVLTMPLLQKLTSDPCKDIREAALELMADLRQLYSEQSFSSGGLRTCGFVLFGMLSILIQLYD